MADFVTLTCPTCGGKLQITPDIDRFACTHCGNEHLVKRGAGVISILPLAESLTGLKRATDRTASELALRRLTEDVTQLQLARQQAEGRAAEHRKVIAAHDTKKSGCQGAIGGLVITPLCYLAYLASEGLTKDVPEDSLLSGLDEMLLLIVLVLGLCAVLMSLGWLLSSDPTPGRKVAEQNLQTAEAEGASLTELMSHKQAEVEKHRQFVALGE